MQKHQAIVVYVVVMMLALGLVPICFAVDAVEATEEINQAELSLNLAFEAAADAHDAGASVDGLLENLDDAGDLLSAAHAAYRSGDYEIASLNAVKCRNAVEGLVAEAGQLEAEAARIKSYNLLFTVFFSIFGLILVLVLGIIGWRVLKKHYFKRILEMRPELEE
jgi:hypothetical protein